MNAILNISSYRFVSLPKPEDWREPILKAARSQELKGTVLLASEGINLFLAGAPGAIRDFLAWLRAHEEFKDLPVKESGSETVPFRKLLVKVKSEIIRMNHPAIRPESGRAPSVDAKTLARWLEQGADDEGREVVTLDTRNAFETDLGRFENAIDWRLAKFSEFPDALASHRAALAGKTVVSYCTGGIRCEKAALYMLAAGMENVLQLEGGILKYFEEAGGRHFEGKCFVFDERVALDESLAPEDSA